MGLEAIRADREVLARNWLAESFFGAQLRRVRVAAAQDGEPLSAFMALTKPGDAMSRSRDDWRAMWSITWRACAGLYGFGDP